VTTIDNKNKASSLNLPHLFPAKIKIEKSKRYKTKKKGKNFIFFFCRNLCYQFSLFIFPEKKSLLFCFVFTFLRKFLAKFELSMFVKVKCFVFSKTQMQDLIIIELFVQTLFFFIHYFQFHQHHSNLHIFDSLFIPF
jgi:hypothetical protein